MVGVKGVGGGRVGNDGDQGGKGWWGQGVGWWGSKDGSGLDWGSRGEVVGFLPPPPHPTTHTLLLPSPPRPLPLETTTLDGLLLIQKK